MKGITENQDKPKMVKGDSAVTFKGIKQFDCGDKVLNDFLQQLKRQCGRDNINALVLLDEGDKVMGFVTASLYQLGRDSIPENTFPYTVPPVFAVIKIPMIAINKQFQRQGWGLELMRAILDYCVESADLVKGIKGVYLDAKVEAQGFYESLDFVALSDVESANGTIPMFISMDTLRDSKKKLLNKSA
ncbi:GNAT family N-acetyltransferase [Atlantibacter hermannii]|uniref:GNAT family N-acetyltransferase n=1 Tax=Atlantibacter hermannii TaxID=565 RepID=UPI002DB656D5|nr:GNAT family N-acetyltransferase [Atlantibacter hermannii]MEB7926096.1 GNAT family N-acetyltransferase [Atlantibacter hermannii]